MKKQNHIQVRLLTAMAAVLGLSTVSASPMHIS